MNNLSLNIINSNQYIDSSTPTSIIYSKRQLFKDKCVNNWLENGKRNLKEFAISIGVNPKQLAQWVHNG